MTDKILDYFGNSHASHIHARGAVTTQKLIELLEAKKGEKVLEIGFGTGATLVQMATRYKADFYGYEVSTIMHHKAHKRVQFCNLQNHIHLTLLATKNQFPAPDNTFDRVYAESILAIQEGDDFTNLLNEIKRVLKPNGVLLFNETIWIDSTSKSTAQQINSACKKSFGIIQANHDYLHLSDWKNALSQIGLIPELEINVATLTPQKEKLSIPTMSSKLFTLIGKVKASASPTMRQNWKNYQLQMNTILNHHDKVMEGVIVRACNKK